MVTHNLTKKFEIVVYGPLTELGGALTVFPILIIRCHAHCCVYLSVRTVQSPGNWKISILLLIIVL